MTDIKNHYCSFCGKSAHEVEKMALREVRNGYMAICSECVALCVKVFLVPDKKKEAKDATI